MPARGILGHGRCLHSKRAEVFWLQIVQMIIAHRRAPRFAPQASAPSGNCCSRPPAFDRDPAVRHQFLILRGDACRIADLRANRHTPPLWCQGLLVFGLVFRGSLSPRATIAAVPIDDRIRPQAPGHLATSAPVRIPPETTSCTSRCRPKSCNALHGFAGYRPAIGMANMFDEDVLGRGGAALHAIDHHNVRPGFHRQSVVSKVGACAAPTLT